MEIEKSVNPPQDVKRKSKKAGDKKFTHFYWQEKNLRRVPKLPASKDVNVIYLFSNYISKIENLSGNLFPNLTSLYLQNNRITKLEDLNIKQLKRLYIGHNNISVVEGLENLVNLEELHLERQRLPDGVSLCFDPRSLASLAKTLQIINVSHNKIASFASLWFLQRLASIDASFCHLDDLQEVCKTITDWRYLSSANFNDNIFSKNHRYREDIIVNCFYLEFLDGKEISDTTRSFLKRLESAKRLRSKYTISNDVPNLPNVVETLPNNYTPPVQKAVTTTILKGKKYNPINLPTINETEDEADTHIAWYALPKRRPFARRYQPKPSTSFEQSTIINKFP